MYTVIQNYKGDKFYLNHAYIGSMSFGSEGMMWTGSHEDATDMLKRAKKTHKGKYYRFSIEEIG